MLLKPYSIVADMFDMFDMFKTMKLLFDDRK